ncbi:MAG: hypothetical protein GTN62_02835 [Gemmatimonadales bacterium]|nr:hypothetical protein [Gemmatimonadales bacterium]NIN10238.1 hypothetical protein [Gemmatimonadales bacterium]NIN49035.1 hypothetical protein [Gemmatimonadales bacterium]NIP06499.1 hypothetical protein [Gemmatimonadales bacterium]NIQ98842.1 hypothetical protein [Gemmatimonadales bacterium]
MLGFGAAGALLALSGRIQPRTAEKWFPRVAVLAAASLIVSPALVHQTPLDATQLAWNLGQWPRLALVYVFLALPFGIGALAIVLALNAEPQRPGKVYGASFVGSGLGTVAGVGILWLVNPVRALALPALLASVGAASAAHQPLRAATRRVVGWATVFVAALVLAYPLWRLDPTPYKGLPQVEAYPDARRVAEPTSPLGWIAAVEARAFRHAPGLSLAYRGEFPTQLALFVDGELAGAATAWPDDSSRFAVLDWLPSALPYALDSLERVLVVGAGGGIEVSNALAHRARSVTAVELLPDLVALTRTFPPGPTNDRNDPRISWVIADARAFTASTRETFDLVTLGPTAGLGTAAAGVHALNEDFLHTVQAYVGYLELLRGGGVLAITRWLTIPPRETVRVILTAAEALRRVVPEQVSTGLVVARSWGTATVLAKPSGFTPQEINALRDWARSRQFDIDWYPGIDVPAPGFHLLDEPTLYQAAQAAVSGTSAAAAFSSAYPFEVTPASDARPYPHHFLRAGAVGAFLERGQGSWLPFAEWGYIALFATLGQSLVLAILLLLIPAIVRTRTAFSLRLVPLLVYFTAIGLAYLAAEIAAIQQLSLLLGHPVYAVAAVLTALLTCSGFGSIWSDRVGDDRGWQVGVGLAVALALLAVLMLPLVHVFQPAHLALRVVLTILVLAPLAFLMGLPFPLGLRAYAAGDTARVAWAWAANGFASVVAAPLAALIALEAGSPALLLVAATAYAVAGILHRATPWTPRSP